MKLIPQNPEGCMVKSA